LGLFYVKKICVNYFVFLGALGFAGAFGAAFGLAGAFGLALTTAGFLAGAFGAAFLAGAFLAGAFAFTGASALTAGTGASTLYGATSVCATGLASSKPKNDFKNLIMIIISLSFNYA
jgi:hypothetical protein